VEPDELPTEEEARQEEEDARHPGPLPVDGDVLFKTDPDPEIHWTAPHTTYLNGYQLAANYLFQKAQESTEEAKRAAQEAKEGKGNWPEMLPMSIEPWLVYPIYFLYRHVIELSLKDLLRVQKRNGWLSADAEKLIDTSHDVLELWNAAKPWVMTFCQRILGKEIPAFEAMLKEIQTHDPNADAGRYPLSNTAPKGKKRILAPSFGTVSPLNLSNFHQNATKLLNIIIWIWTLYEEMIQDEENERWWREQEQGGS